MRRQPDAVRSTAWRINGTAVAADVVNVQERSSRHVLSATTMRMLQQRVPLTLLLDLAAPPDANELYAAEGARFEWLPRRQLADERAMS